MILHLLWAAFMLLGLPLGFLLRSPTLRWAHFLGMMVTASIAALGKYCPLTVWEEDLRRAADPGFSYGGSFLAHRLGPILYPDISPGILNGISVAWGILTLAAILIQWPEAPGFLSKKGSLR